MKLGIIGTNFVSDMFMEALKEVKGVEVVAVCSKRFENALKFQAKYNILHVYNSYQEMIGDKKINAVYVATPNSTHFEICKYALMNQMHTYCEKPFMVNEDQVKTIYAIAKSQKLFIHDGIIPLYTENLQILKNNLSQIGKIRKVVLSFGKYSSRYDAYLKGENPTTFRKELANGSMMDLGVYVLAVAIALFGEPIDIYASATLLDTQVDGLGTMLLKYNDFEAVLLHSKISDTKIVSEIQGEKGIIQIHKPSLMEEIYLIKGNKTLKISQDEKSSFSYQIQDFVDNVLNNRLESEKVPHDLTYKIIKNLTIARKKCGVIYNGD